MTGVPHRSISTFKVFIETSTFQQVPNGVKMSTDLDILGNITLFQNGAMKCTCYVKYSLKLYQWKRIAHFGLKMFYTSVPV